MNDHPLDKLRTAFAKKLEQRDVMRDAAAVIMDRYMATVRDGAPDTRLFMEAVTMQDEADRLIDPETLLALGEIEYGIARNDEIG